MTPRARSNLAPLRSLVPPLAVLAAALAASTAGAAEPAPLRGDLRTHDPGIARDRESGDFYVFSTGDPKIGDGTPQIRRSSDLETWTYAGTVFDRIPQWVRDAVPGVENLWAPDVYEHDGVYYMYYTGSTFGSNVSVIGLATNTALDPNDPDYAWVDRGRVVGSDRSVDYNAIDAGVVEDAAGTPWLAFGSFFSGIRMIELEWPSGKAAPRRGEPLRLADRRQPPNAIEAPYVVQRDGFFYLFVSLDSCCRGTQSTYKIAVGRSREVTGPYVDRDGRPMLEGGATVLLSSQGGRIGPGGQSLSGDLMAHHFYDAAANGDFRLSIRVVRWEDGWPVIQ